MIMLDCDTMQRQARQPYLQLFVDEADSRELKALGCDAHLAVEAEQVRLLVLCSGP